MVSIALSTCQRTIIVGALYRPANADIAISESLRDFIYESRKAYRDAIVCGDFNPPSIDWQLSTAVPPCRNLAALINIPFSLCLKQTVHMPIRVTDNTGSSIDLVFVYDAIGELRYGDEIAPAISGDEAVFFRS